MSLRRWLAGITAIALVGVAAPAHAATSVTLPGHTSDSSDLRLIGASDSGYLVEQGEAPASRMVAGAPGTTLSSIGSPAWNIADARGGYAWYHTGSTVSRIDLRTKVRAAFPAPVTPLAFTPDGWLSVENGSLVRHVAGGASTTLITGIDPEIYPPAATADANGAVVLYGAVRNGIQDRFVGLMTWGRPGVETVWSQSQGAVYQLQITSVTLSPSRVSWTTVTEFNGGAQFVHQRARAGGAITTTAAPDGVSAFGLAAAGDALALPTLSTGNYYVDPATVKVLSGGTWRTVTMPGPDGLLKSSGTRFYMGVSGKNTVAGVYGFGATGAPTRLAPLAAAPAVTTGVSLSAGYLTTADDAVATVVDNGSLWRRPVSGAADVTVGTETRLSPLAAVGGNALVEAPMEFSAARGMIRKPGTEFSNLGPFQLIDRGVVTRTLPAEPYAPSPEISGPYAVVGWLVYRADGSLARDLSTENAGRVALFGKTVVYQANGKLLMRDLEKPAAAPTTLATSGICNAQLSLCGFGLGAWYDTVAWERLDGKIVVRTLSTGASRVVDTGGGGWTLRLSDQAMTWGSGNDTRVLDLGSATSTPVTLSGLRNGVADGHLLAGIDPGTHGVVVRTLPFGSSRKTPVRLIGTLAPASFAPGAWAPQFDLTKPATAVKLTIKQGTTTVRTLAGTAPDGSIRDLTWDGRNTAGARVTNGAYTYTLTANAADGEGALAPVNGLVTVR